MTPRAILLDIEGTTTRIAFVHDVLFPFARVRLGAFLERARDTPAVGLVLTLLVAEHLSDRQRGESPPPLELRDGSPSRASAVGYLEWLMDRDRKSPALKDLQGLIREDGYRAGALTGEVFPDVAPAIRRWRAAGIDVAIYSSGSELAQRLLFGSTPEGDLTPLLSGFFDTRVGAKSDAASYARIAAALGHTPADVLFLSDVTAELDAAREAGADTVLVTRPVNSQMMSGLHRVVASFDQVL